MDTSVKRILSGIRTTARPHIGNYHGALKNWVKLQHTHQCLFFAADLHALTTEYESHKDLASLTREMILDWLAVGLDPAKCTIFVQSQVAAHAELHVLLSMITPLSWLLRVPTYKDQQEALQEHHNLATYGFLGYPVLQSADILLYQADYVPIGQDQLPHLEITREIARRFNSIYGTAHKYLRRRDTAYGKLTQDVALQLQQAASQYKEAGDMQVLQQALVLLEQNRANLDPLEFAALSGELKHGACEILKEPEALLTDTPILPGLDGRKMSKSYNNTIQIVEDPQVLSSKILKMPTDPARVKRTDRGDPEKCPVWGLHKTYTTKPDEIKWVNDGCRSAGIGCVDCKKLLVNNMELEQQEFRARRKEYETRPSLVKDIIESGKLAAHTIADETLRSIKTAIGLEI